MTTKRKKVARCSNGPCQRDAKVGNECWGCYRKRLRDAQRTTPKKVVEDLGPDPARFEFKGPAELKARLHAAVPLDARSRFMRDAVREKLEREASGA